MALATGLMTVVGQCMGAGRTEDARYYIKKLTFWAFGLLFIFNWLAMALAPIAGRLAGMDNEARSLMLSTLLKISIVKPFFWMWAFVPAHGMRAAGDVKFGMVVSTCTMWVIRVGLSTLLCRHFSMGLMGIWSGYFIDWIARGTIFYLRYRSGKWAKQKVIDR